MTKIILGVALSASLAIGSNWSYDNSSVESALENYKEAKDELSKGNHIAAYAHLVKARNLKRPNSGGTKLKYSVSKIVWTDGAVAPKKEKIRTTRTVEYNLKELEGDILRGATAKAFIVAQCSSTTNKVDIQAFNPIGVYGKDNKTSFSLNNLTVSIDSRRANLSSISPNNYAKSTLNSSNCSSDKISLNDRDGFVVN